MRKHAFLLLLFVSNVLLLSIFYSGAFASRSARASEVKYAVETRDGVPMITIDGKPTRSRIFFGMSGSQTIMARPEFSRVEFNFTAEEDGAGQGTFHFRFGRQRGSIVLDNYSIVDAETNQSLAGEYTFEEASDFTANWGTWNTEVDGVRIASLQVKDGVGIDGSRALAIQITPDSERVTNDFHLFHRRNLNIVRGKTYRVRFDIRADVDRRVFVNFYRPSEPSYVKLGECGKNVLASQTQLAASAGVNSVSFLSNSTVWPTKDGTYDWTDLEKTCDEILRANPNALLIPRLNFNATKEWLDANPDARAVWRNAKSDWDAQGWDWAAPASKKYRQVAREALVATIRRLEEKYGDSIAGYHPCGQNTSEWFTPNTWTEGYAGFSNADRDAFRAYLREKYATVDDLRASWQDDSISFETAEVPSVEERDASRKRPIIESRKLVDFNEYWQREMTSFILELARAVKEETDGKKLTFFFYGYSYEFSSVLKGPAASAHYALRDLLDSPDVDVVCSPISYFERGPGGAASCMLNAESVLAAGKLYLYEDDSRTYIAHSLGEKLGSATTSEESVNIVRRNLGQATMRNFGAWLMDLGASGWYDAPELWQVCADLAPIEEELLKTPRRFRPEVGVFLSEKSMLRISSGEFTAKAISYFRRTLNRFGAPYAQYDLDDLISDRVPVPKLTIILNSEAVDRDALEYARKLAKNGQTRLLEIGFDPPDLQTVRAAARDAGVHLYVDEECSAWANLPFATICATSSEPIHFHAPKGFNVVRDAITDEVYTTDGNCVFDLKSGEVKILRIE